MSRATVRHIILRHGFEIFEVSGNKGDTYSSARFRPCKRSEVAHVRVQLKGDLQLGPWLQKTGEHSDMLPDPHERAVYTGTLLTNNYVHWCLRRKRADGSMADWDYKWCTADHFVLRVGSYAMLGGGNFLVNSIRRPPVSLVYAELNEALIEPTSTKCFALAFWPEGD